MISPGGLLDRARRVQGPPMKRALLLCRQSDTRDAGADSLSLESQEQALRDRAPITSR